MDYLDWDLVDLLARRDCGPEEFAQVKEYLMTYGTKFLNRPDFFEWVLAHAKPLTEWSRQNLRQQKEPQCPPNRTS